MKVKGGLGLDSFSSINYDVHIWVLSNSIHLCTDWNPDELMSCWKIQLNLLVGGYWTIYRKTGLFDEHLSKRKLQNETTIKVIFDALRIRNFIDFILFELFVNKPTIECAVVSATQTRFGCQLPARSHIKTNPSKWNTQHRGAGLNHQKSNIICNFFTFARASTEWNRSQPRKPIKWNIIILCSGRRSFVRLGRQRIPNIFNFVSDYGMCFWCSKYSKRNVLGGESEAGKCAEMPPNIRQRTKININDLFQFRIRLKLKPNICGKSGQSAVRAPVYSPALYTRCAIRSASFECILYCIVFTIFPSSNYFARFAVGATSKWIIFVERIAAR